MRKDGWNPWVVEKWNPHSGTRLDLWNFGDILAMREGSPHLIIQTTTKSNASARVKKILAEASAYLWLLTGGRIVVHGWRAIVTGLRRRWHCFETEITLNDFGNRPPP